VTGVPLAWDAAVTLTASWQKVFSGDPKLGFFSQRDRYATALDQGQVLAPARDLDQMQAIVTNSTVDGVLAAFFAILIVIVIGDAVRVWVRVLRDRRPARLAEAPYVESRIVAGSGLLPTPEERQQRQLVGAGVGGGRPGVGGDGMPVDDVPTDEDRPDRRGP
jgi:carbon starvation protein